MEFKRLVKKAGAFSLCALLLFSTSNTSASGSNYVLNNSVKVYVDAQSAKTGVGAKATYASGTYYIYKSYNGMINISRVQGQPGAWINPNDNLTKVVAPVTTEKTPSSTTSGTYSLAIKVNKYISASNAKTETGSRGYYYPGSYYIYKSYDGMLNISKVKGAPGAWINPAENKVSTVVVKPVEPEVVKPVEPEVTKPVDVVVTPVTETKQYASGDQFVVTKSTPVFISADLAKQDKGSSNVYYPGTYYVYKVYGDCINISRVKGSAGGWIYLPKTSSTPTTNTTVSTHSFIQKIGEEARRIAKENDLYASVMIAQAICETGYGSSTLSKEPNNNLFGIKGTYNGQSVSIRTFEYYNGVKYYTTAEFRKYDNIAQSLQDYADFLTGAGNSRSWAYNFYSGVRRSNTTSYKDATAWLTGRYATSPTYAATLNTYIEKHNLTQYD